jgi:hypothetical protein
MSGRNGDRSRFSLERRRRITKRQRIRELRSAQTPNAIHVDSKPKETDRETVREQHDL